MALGLKQRDMNKSKIKTINPLVEQIIDALHDATDLDNGDVNLSYFSSLLNCVLRNTADVEKELEVTNKLLDEVNKVMKAIPECPVHGFCIPYALEWVESKKT